jgi:hypothetical protein
MSRTKKGKLTLSKPRAFSRKFRRIKVIELENGDWEIEFLLNKENKIVGDTKEMVSDAQNSRDQNAKWRNGRKES